MIETAITILVSVLFGYYMGKDKNPKQDLQEWAQKATKFAGSIPKTFEPDLQPGAIKRPSAKQLAVINEPAIIKEGKEAIKETLDKVPELQEAKKVVEQRKAEGTWIP